jgi:hypothetical protein
MFRRNLLSPSSLPCSYVGESRCCRRLVCVCETGRCPIPEGSNFGYSTAIRISDSTTQCFERLIILV